MLRAAFLTCLLACVPVSAYADAVQMATSAGTYNGPGTFQLSNGTQVQLISGTLVVASDGSIAAIASNDNVSVNGTPPTVGGGAVDLGSGTVSVGGGGGIILVGAGGLVAANGAATTGGSLKAGGPIGVASGSVQLAGGNLGNVQLTGTSVLNWQRFTITASEVARFAQGGGSAAVLNRVMQLNSAISGSLSTDGRIWLESGGQLLLARTGSGAIEPAAVAQSVATASTSGGTALAAVGTLPNGAHSRPLQYRTAPGTKTTWVAGDLGRDDHGARDGHLLLGEFGVGYNHGPFQINAAFGQTRTRQDADLGGHAHTDGNYLLVETLVPLAERPTGDGPWLTLGAYGHWGDADIRRGYLNLGLPDSSSGQPDTRTWGVRARLDWEGAAAIGGFSLSPYADLGYSALRMDGYTESGGGFPARYDTRRESQSELRLGVVATKSLGDASRLVSQLDLAHRFEKRGARTGGEVVGMFSFDLPGQEIKQDWLRLGVGIEARFGEGTGALMFNLTSKGNAPNVWLAASYRIGF